MIFDSYYKVGGSLKANHNTYVVRKADKQIFELLKAGKYCFVFNSRQMGKSSLRVQTMKKLRASGIKCASIDLTIIGSHVTQEKWYKGFANQLLSNLEIDELDLNSWWNKNQGWTEVQRLNQLIESVLLKKFASSIVIFLDEIDSLLPSDFKDDFFAFIRACYNQRAEQAKYERLTFCLLGVATPVDLIQERGRTPFNIGSSIELTGFSFEEAKDALIPGLEGKVEHPEAVVQEVLAWTGGQPFLTQKLCSLIVQQTESSKPNINEVVQNYIIHNWEAQDEPEHLRTIRDRLLSNELRAIRLLGLYQQFLPAATSPFSSLIMENSTARGVAIDGSNEQTELRLSGLVVKKDGYLQVYNPIYQAVFHQDWVKQQLDKLRPYSEAINGWLNSNRDSSWLLRGKALDDAQAWAMGKSLSDLDYQFFDASQKISFEKERTEKKAQIKANQILAEANQKANRIIRTGGIVAFILVVVSLLSVIYAQQQLKTAKEAGEGTRLTQVADNALRQFESRQLDGLLLAMQAGQDLKKLVKGERSLAKYQTIIPLSALLNILVNIREQNQLESQQDKLSSVSFSPDGEIIASGSDDGTIKLWQRDGTPMTPLTGHQGWVTSVSFSPDGQIIASGSDDGTVKLWQRDGTAITLTGHKKKVNSVSFSPNGETIASGSDDGTVKLWQRDGTAIATLNRDASLVKSVSFSPDGKTVASGGDDGTVKLWQRDGTPLTTLTRHQGWVTSVSFSPDGKTIASGSDDGTVKLWQQDGTLLTTLDRQGRVTSISFSPLGETIAFGSADQTVKLWNWKRDRNPLTTLTGHIGKVNSVSFSPDGKIIASATDEGTVKLWKWKQDRNPLTTLTGHTGKIFNSVSFSPDGKIIASATDEGTVKLWQRDGTKITTLTGHTGFVASVSFSPDGKIIALGTDEGTVKLWQRDGTKITTIPVNASLVTSVSFSPDGKTIASGSDDGTVKLWQRDGTRIATRQGHKSWVTSVSFSPDGETIASGGDDDDPTIKLWKRDGTPITSLHRHKKQVNSISFSPDGETIASGSRDQTVKLWKRDGTPLTILTGHSDSVTSVTFSPDGQILASGSDDQTVKLWKRDGTPLTTLAGHSDSVTSVTFSPDGQILASGSTDGTAILWSLNLDDVLARGCTWLKDYFVTHPEKLNTLTACTRK